MDGLIQLAIIVIFVLISAAAQFMKEKPKKPRRPVERQLPPRPQAGGQRPARPQAGGQQQPQRPQGGRLEAEIEDFLRQVTGQAPKQDPAVQDPGIAEPVMAEPVEPMMAEPIVLTTEPMRPLPGNAGIGRESVAEHVQSHIQEGGLERRDAHLARVIENRDEAMDARLHEVFDHELGAIRTTSQSAAVTKIERRSRSQQEITADDVLAFFQSTDDIRKAIIMKEILTPKAYDW